MKRRDETERQLARILLDAAQAEQESGKGFMVPEDVLADLRPPERATTHAARLVVGVSDRVWEHELHRHTMVREVLGGAGKSHRRPA